MAATLDAGPSVSLAMEKRHTGCAQNFALTCGPTNALPAHRAAWTATSPFLNGSEQIPQVVTSSRSAISAVGFAGTILGASVLVFPMLDLHIRSGRLPLRYPRLKRRRTKFAQDLQPTR
jgi:hypothetical protein